MKRVRLALAAIITTGPTLTGHAAPQASVRLDFPPGYFAAKPASPKIEARTAGDNCTSNCVNFDDGYAWAEGRKFKKEEQCRGPSRAFVEGCMTYITERKRQIR
jgi:hypothetical protein